VKLGIFIFHNQFTDLKPEQSNEMENLWKAYNATFLNA
jgi:hypothetical protein